MDTKPLAWKTYAIGTLIKEPSGTEWKIVDCVVRKTDKGYRSRVFTLAAQDGSCRHVRKTSRGITMLSAGIEVEVSVPAPVVSMPLPEPKPGAVRHANHEALLRVVGRRLNVWLVGPAGSGKTSAAQAVAEDLKLPFHATSVGPQTTKTDLMGYMDATGNYIRTPLREWFENGGVFLLDEVDAGNPGVLTILNSMLANGFAQFPDKMVKQHPDAVLVAGANTIGQGGDRQYVGRQQIDGATLDRFVFMVWDYDPAIEASIAGVPMSVFSKAPRPKTYHFIKNASPEATQASCEELVRFVLAVRAADSALHTRFIVSPRASKHGAALVREGFSMADALELTLWKSVAADTRKKLEEKARQILNGAR